MAKEIGRKHSIALGIETTPGTAGAIDVWLPLEEAQFTPKTEVVTDESGFGTISAGADGHVVKKWAEFKGKGVVRPTSFGYLLLLALGTAGSPTLVETGVYTHAFTVKNDNAHPTTTLIHDDATQEEQATYGMIDTVTISGEASDYLRFDTAIKSKSTTDVTGNTPAFTATGETPFLVSKVSVKFATDIAGLSGASRVGVTSFNLNIEKNLTQIFQTSTDGTEALDFGSQHNQDLRVTGDFELVYDSKTYRDLALAGTKQAIEIYVEGRTLIGATKYEAITIQLASVVLTEWDRSSNNDEIVKQTFGFTGLYKLAETKQLTATLQNAKATIYA